MIIRRTLATVGAAAVIIATSVSQAAAQPGMGRFDRPLEGFTKAQTTLTATHPLQAGLDPEPLAAAWQTIESHTTAQGDREHPMYAGAVLSYGHRGRVVFTGATGQALKYADGDGTELPAEEQIPATTDTIYDMASVTKLFTSIVIMTLVEDGAVDLDEPVASYVPEFAENDKEAITVRQLLTHTSGLPAWLPLWASEPDPESRMQAALTAELQDDPGTTYRYSDLNLITLGELAHRVTGTALDELVAERITEPLGMADTGFNPSADVRDRIAATEYQAVPDRGMVWGEVHDENAWSLGGVAGHAGIFSTAGDMAVLAQALLNGGVYDGQRILSEASVTAMITNENTEFPGDEHGLGFELNQSWYMGGLGGPRTAGHTGYTGTSLVIDFASGSFAILLTNRVHPSRSWGSNNPAREAASDALAEAMRVQPRKGVDAWYSGEEDSTSSTLTLPVTVPGGGAEVTADTLIGTEKGWDHLYLEASTDSGETWATQPYTIDGETIDGPYSGDGRRTWKEFRTALPEGEVTLRWRYETDTRYTGFGIYLDDLQVSAAGQVINSPERNPEVLTADGWDLVTS